LATRSFSSSYSVGEARGGNVRPFDTLFTRCLTALQSTEFGPDEIEQLIVTNPARAFAVGVRSA
jgi:hypothetical protein